MVLTARLAFIALIPLGIFLLVKAIKLIRASFFGAVVAEARLAQQRVNLAIPEEGLYAIWLRGNRAEISSTTGFQPTVWENATKAVVPLSRTIGRTYASDGEGFRLKLFTFSAAAGSYTLDTGELPQASKGGLARLFASQPIDPANFVVQVRKTKPFYYGMFGILLCVASGFLIIGGIILAMLAGQLVAR